MQSEIPVGLGQEIARTIFLVESLIWETEIFLYFDYLNLLFI